MLPIISNLKFLTSLELKKNYLNANSMKYLTKNASKDSF